MKFHLWTAFMSLCLVGAGAVLFQLGSDPVLSFRVMGSLEEKMIYIVMAMVGLLIMLAGAQMFANTIVESIEQAMTNASNKRHARKVAKAMFANSTEIPAFLPARPVAPAPPTVASPVFIPPHTEFIPRVDEPLIPSYRPTQVAQSPFSS